MGMTDILYLQVNIVGMMVLYIMLMNQQNIDNGTNRQRAFRYLNYSVFIILILDSCMWLIDGKQFPYSNQIYWAVTSFYYFFNCGIPFIWFIYISKFFYQNQRDNKRLFIVMGIPIILNAFLILMNLKYPIYFIIDENNVYTRASFFVVCLLLALPYLAVPFLQCLRIYKTSDNILEKKDCALIMKIHILPMIGIITQTLIYGVSLIWICQVLSLLCFFVNFQNKIISMDPLTQLNNRYQFNVCLQSFGRGMTQGGINAIILIDIDKFKGINDRFGHVFGDKVLIDVASILMRACAGEDTIVGRFGGDEFYVFCKGSAKEEIIGRMNDFVVEYNARDSHGIGLSLSIGSSDFQGKETKRTEDIVELADQAMYKNKVK